MGQVQRFLAFEESFCRDRSALLPHGCGNRREKHHGDYGHRHAWTDLHPFTRQHLRGGKHEKRRKARAEISHPIDRIGQHEIQRVPASP
jgi:hypothetical protein